VGSWFPRFQVRDSARCGCGAAAFARGAHSRLTAWVCRLAVSQHGSSLALLACGSSALAPLRVSPPWVRQDGSSLRSSPVPQSHCVTLEDSRVLATTLGWRLAWASMLAAARGLASSLRSGQAHGGATLRSATASSPPVSSLQSAPTVPSLRSAATPQSCSFHCGPPGRRSPPRYAARHTPARCRRSECSQARFLSRWRGSPLWTPRRLGVRLLGDSRAHSQSLVLRDRQALVVSTPRINSRPQHRASIQGCEPVARRCVAP